MHTLIIGDYAFHACYGTGQVIGTGLFTIVLFQYNGSPIRISIPSAKALTVLEFRHTYDAEAQRRFTADVRHMKSAALWQTGYSRNRIARLARRLL
jgi:hypothetical protein